MTEGFTYPSHEAERVVRMEYIRGGKSDGPKEAPARFAVADLDALQIPAEPLWLIDDLLPRTGLGIVVGPPKNLKSFLLADALFHVAMDRKWAGRRVRQGAVVYITSEGVEGFKRRLIAMRKHYGVEGRGTPFGLITQAPDFGHATDDHKILSEQIRAYLASKGNPPLRAVVIDTLARSMKGADENTAKDMSVFSDNCDHLAKAFDCLVIGVHHTGKDASRGARGSNALDGAVDVMWTVEKGDPISTATIQHMKDGEDGLTWQFRIVPFTIAAASATSSLVATCVVEIVSEPAPAKDAQPTRNQKLGDNPRLLFDIIRKAMNEAGEFVKGPVEVPHDQRALCRENLKRYLEPNGYWDDDQPPNQKRATLSKDLKTLKARGRIGLTKDFLWLLDRQRNQAQPGRN